MWLFNRGSLGKANRDKGCVPPSGTSWEFGFVLFSRTPHHKGVSIDLKIFVFLGPTD